MVVFQNKTKPKPNVPPKARFAPWLSPQSPKFPWGEKPPQKRTVPGRIHGTCQVSKRPPKILGFPRSPCPQETHKTTLEVKRIKTSCFKKNNPKDLFHPEDVKEFSIAPPVPDNIPTPPPPQTGLDGKKNNDSKGTWVLKKRPEKPRRLGNHLNDVPQPRLFTKNATLFVKARGCPLTLGGPGLEKSSQLLRTEKNRKVAPVKKPPIRENRNPPLGRGGCWVTQLGFVLGWGGDNRKI